MEWIPRYKKYAKGISNKSRNDKETIFDDLYALLYREDFLFQSISNLQKNLGSSTPGIDIFYYSCLHTLANKQNTSLRKIMNKYGEPIKVSQSKKGKGNKIVDQTIYWLNYTSKL